MKIKIKNKVYLPRFNLDKGEVWNYSGKLIRQENDSDGILTIGDGKIKPEDYKILNRNKKWKSK